ncbi:MAG TPA: PTS sugar transporter subunit IIC [Firmicutes bacterium]|nr:PTS sugar transporter subunit IIC [Bacillota bacterium]
MKKVWINSLNGMGFGLLSTLVVGTILVQMGTLFNVELLITIGNIAKVFMSCAIGAGVAYQLKAPSLVMFSAIVTAAIGANAIHQIDNQMILSVGDPAGAYVAAFVTTYVGSKIIGKTKVDILLVPMICLVVGGTVGFIVSPLVSQLMTSIGNIINYATELSPAIMGAIIAVIMSWVILSPISSAALAASLGLSGLAAGAAVVGCSCSMIGFAVASYADNGFSGVLSQGLGTSKIQFANAMQHPRIVIAPTIASLICGALSSSVFLMSCNSIGAGMGSSGFVGQIQTIAVMGAAAIPKIMLLHFLTPAIIVAIVTYYLKKHQLIKAGDMRLSE